MLIEEGLINIDQLLQAFKLQNITGKRLGDVLLDLKVINKEHLDILFSIREVAATINTEV